MNDMILERALHAIARAEGSDVADLATDGARGHYKSAIAFVRRRGEEGPAYVIKFEPRGAVTGQRPPSPAERAEGGGDTRGQWSPRAEYEGFRFVETRLGRVEGFGAIRPVAYGENPSFLVTAHQPGESLRPTFDRALRGDAKSLRRATGAAESIGRWARAVFYAEPIAGDGRRPAEVIAFVDDRIAEIGFRGSTAKALSRLRGAVERLLDGLSTPLIDDLAMSHAAHGDLAPQNFIIDQAGLLYPLDLEGFRHRPSDVDVLKFRLRLEQALVLRRSRRDAAESLWAAFIAVRASQKDEHALLAVRHLCDLSAALAWHMGGARRHGRTAGVRLVSRLKNRLWVRGRLRWLRDLPGDPEQVVRRFTARL